MLLLNVWQTQYLYELTDAIATFFAYHLLAAQLKSVFSPAALS
jgi:hypothetical protein